MPRVRLGQNKLSILISTMLLLIGLSAGAFAQSIAPELYGPLKYRHIGPPGNRLAAVAGIVGDPNIIYAGAASGGIWKTTDGGTHWTPIFDDKEVSSVSALAVAASDPNVVWAGTGETFIRSNISIGNGIYKSTDAGKTWQHMGLEATGRIARVLIDPRNPDVVFAGIQTWSSRRRWDIRTGLSRSGASIVQPTAV